MYFGEGYYMAGMHAFWWLFWILLVLVVVFGFQPRSRKPGDRPRESPHEILRRRLALGEIKKEEYEEIRQVLDRDK